MSKYKICVIFDQNSTSSKNESLEPVHVHVCIIDVRQRLTYNLIHYKQYREKETCLYPLLSVHTSSEWKLLFNRVVIMSRSLTTHLSRLPEYVCVCLSFFARSAAKTGFQREVSRLYTHTYSHTQKKTHTPCACCPLLTEQSGCYTRVIPILFPHLFLSLVKVQHE